MVALTEIMGPEGDPVVVLLNAREWETTEIERPVVDTLECWEIVNLTADTHPIHLHLIQFRLANRQPFDVDDYMQDVFGTTELSLADVGTVHGSFPAPGPYLTGAPVGPPPTERGWKDTIQAHPGTVTRILVPFGPSAAARHPLRSVDDGEPVHRQVRVALPHPRSRGQRDDAALRGRARVATVATGGGPAGPPPVRSRGW